MINVIHSFDEFKKHFPGAEKYEAQELDTLYRHTLLNTIHRLMHSMTSMLSNRAAFTMTIEHAGAALQVEPEFQPIETAELHRWAVTILTLTEACGMAPNRVDVSMPTSVDADWKPKEVRG